MMKRFALFFALLVCACSHAPIVKMPMFYQNAPKLAYIEEGTGAPVVFVHGLAGDYRSFEAVRPAISKKYRFIALSRRYHYPNPPIGKATAYTYELHSEDVAGFIRDLNSGPVHLVGYSWGGAVVLRVALQHPDLVRSLVLAEPNAGNLISHIPEASRELKSRNAMTAKVKQAISAGDEKGALEIAIAWVENSEDAFNKRPDDSRKIMMDNAATVGPSLQAPALKISCDDLKQIHLPVLIIQGDQTRPYYSLIAKQLNSCISDSEKEIVTGSRHNMFIDNPAGTGDLILGFLSKHPVDH